MGFFSRVNAALGALLGGTIQLHPRETQYKQAIFATATSELLLNCDGCSSASLQIAGAYTATIEVHGTIDGTNWWPILLNPYNVAALNPLLQIINTAGLWTFKCGQFAGLRVRTTTLSAGAPVVTLAAENGLLDDFALADAPNIVTSVGIASAALTLTIPAPGAGLRNKLTYLSINRFAAVALVASGAPITVTSSGFPGSLAFTLEQDALPLGAVSRLREDVAFPIPATAQNTAMTIAIPAIPNVILRATAGYKLGQ
jgi:hypothetical protein